MRSRLAGASGRVDKNNGQPHELTCGHYFSQHAFTFLGENHINHSKKVAVPSHSLSKKSEVYCTSNSFDP